MSKIWLKGIIFDPKSGKVIVRWEDQPLPETLQIKHLRSYLERRFGQPLETNCGDAKGMTFWAPRDSGPKGSALLAIPLMRDPESGEIFSIFKRIAQLEPLAAGLGSPDGLELPGFDLDQPWVGPMFNSTHLRQAANDAAARAVRAWIIASGLAAEIEGIRAGQPTAPPAPGLASLREHVDHAAKSAAAAADPAWNLCEKVNKYAAAIGTADKPDRRAVRKVHEAEAQLLGAYEKTLEFAEEAECDARRLAQLGLGISAHLGSSARVERLDRACVAVLRPPDGHGIASSLLSDGVTLRSGSRDELIVEVAGVLCRLLIDRGTKVRFEVPGPAGGCFEFVVEEGDVLAAHSKEASPAPKVRGESEGSDRPRRGKGQSVLVRKWPSPVTVLEPAKMAVDRLFDTFGLEQPSQLVATVEAAPPVSPTPGDQTPHGPQHWVM